MKLSVTTSLQNPIIQIIVAVALSALMFFALILMKKSSAGEFVAYLTAAFMLPRSVKFISSANAKIQKGIAAAESLFEVLDEPIEKDDGKKTVIDCNGGVEFKNVFFKYSGAEKYAIKNISFKIQPGQTVALVGPSGSGKTSLVNVLMRFYEYNRGQVLLDGVDINSIKMQSLRGSMAMVSQNITLFDDTVRNNIVYGSGAIDNDLLEQAIKNSYVSEFVSGLDLGFDTQIGEHGVKLSGGQRQRLALARAMYRDASILILDEATSALDTRSEKYIQEALRGMQKKRTSLIIAHRLTTIENADMIFVMENGEIVERGPHKELIGRKGLYAKLHHMEFK